MRRAAWIGVAGAAAIAIGGAGYVVGHQSASPASDRNEIVQVTTTTSTTLLPTTTTTTTLPPVTTTTIAMVTVPDIVAIATHCGCHALTSDVTEAGFQARYVRTSSGACYFTDPLNGQQAWNTGEVVDQDPLAGDQAPLGSFITLYEC